MDWGDSKNLPAVEPLVGPKLLLRFQEARPYEKPRPFFGSKWSKLPCLKACPEPC